MKLTIFILCFSLCRLLTASSPDTEMALCNQFGEEFTIVKPIDQKLNFSTEDFRSGYSCIWKIKIDQTTEAISRWEGDVPKEWEEVCEFYVFPHDYEDKDRYQKFEDFSMQFYEEVKGVFLDNDMQLMEDVQLPVIEDGNLLRMNFYCHGKRPFASLLYDTRLHAKLHIVMSEKNIYVMRTWSHYPNSEDVDEFFNSLKIENQADSWR